VIIGSTTDGEIMNGKVSSGKVVLSFTQFEHTTLKVAAIEHKVDGYFSGQYLAKELIGEDTKLLIAFVDGLHTNGEEFLSGIDSVVLMIRSLLQEAMLQTMVSLQIHWSLLKNISLAMVL
jgi:hypothetical protein